MEKILTERTLSGSRYVTESFGAESNQDVSLFVLLPESGDILIQHSNDGANWFDVYASTRSITSSDIIRLDQISGALNYRVSCSVSATTLKLIY